MRGTGRALGSAPSRHKSVSAQAGHDPSRKIMSAADAA